MSVLNFTINFHRLSDAQSKSQIITGRFSFLIGAAVIFVVLSVLIPLSADTRSSKDPVKISFDKIYVFWGVNKELANIKVVFSEDDCVIKMGDKKLFINSCDVSGTFDLTKFAGDKKEANSKEREELQLKDETSHIIPIQVEIKAENSSFQKIIGMEKVVFEKDISFKECEIGKIMLVGTTFKGKFKFVNTKVKESSRFDNLNFLDTTSFDSSNFIEDVIFSNVIFNEFANFKKVKFKKKVEFKGGVELNGGVSFKNASFGLHPKENKPGELSYSLDFTSFKEVIFKKNIFLHNAKFYHDVFFTKSYFHGTTDFSYAHFKKDVLFNGSQFFYIEIQDKKKPDPSCKSREIDNVTPETELPESRQKDKYCFDFTNVDFSGEGKRVEFKNVIYHPKCKADFSGVFFNQKSGVVNFEGAKFEDEANFILTYFWDGANFHQATFRGDAHFQLMRVRSKGEGEARRISFYGTRFRGNVNFSSADLGAYTTFYKAQIGPKNDDNSNISMYDYPKYDFRNISLGSKGSIRNLFKESIIPAKNLMIFLFYVAIAIHLVIFCLIYRNIRNEKSRKIKELEASKAMEEKEGKNEEKYFKHLLFLSSYYFKLGYYENAAIIISFCTVGVFYTWHVSYWFDIAAITSLWVIYMTLVLIVTAYIGKLIIPATTSIGVANPQRSEYSDLSSSYSMQKNNPLPRDVFVSLEKAVKYFAPATYGISGARGAGKTFAARHVAENIWKKNTEEGRKESTGGISSNLGPIIFPAPTQYDEKDFLIALHRNICEKVINAIKIDKEVLLKVPETSTFDPDKSQLQPLTLKIVLLLTGIFAAFWILYFIKPFADKDYAPLGILALGIVWQAVRVYSNLKFSDRLKKKFENKSRGYKEEEQKRFKAKGELFLHSFKVIDSLKFQQTLTDSSSASLSRFGLSFGGGWSKSRAERDLTLIQLVEDFKEYIGKVSEAFGHTLLIVIDEIDKIEDGEKARLFLNQIKGIFHAPGAVYIITVSDDIIESFQMRTMTDRDPVDSSFDDIFHIEPLNVNDCVEFLNKRCSIKNHCDEYENKTQNNNRNNLLLLIAILSGGSPRDLLRYARRLVGNKDDYNLELFIAELQTEAFNGTIQAINSSNLKKENKAKALDAVSIIKEKSKTIEKAILEKDSALAHSLVIQFLKRFILLDKLKEHYEELFKQSKPAIDRLREIATIPHLTIDEFIKILKNNDFEIDHPVLKAIEADHEAANNGKGDD